jgi:outer membrane protein OmpA-like peptidoglycan-associated protein
VRYAGGGERSWLALFSLLAAAGIMRRRRRHAGAKLVLSALALLTFATEAHAQVAVEQFRPAPLASDGFALSRPEVLRKHQWGLLGLLDYAKDPLVLKYENPDSQVRVIKHHLVLHGGIAVSLSERWTVFGTLPIHLLMTGDAPMTLTSKADGAGLGDVAFGGRVLLVGSATQRGALAFEGLVRLPTARALNRNQHYSGDKIGNWEPALVGELHFGRFDVRLRGGMRVRRTVTVGDLKLGPEIVYGAGARLRFTDNFYGHVELYGSSNIADLGDRERTPLELLAGVKYGMGDWFAGLAAGPGLVQGYGSPDVRAIASLGYAPVPRAQEPKDSDGDGLLDANDKCPRAREDRDQFEDADGCPDPDNDQDGILDTADACVTLAEDRDNFEDGDGCPDPDNDKDGLLDASDQCPNEAEDQDSFEDENGCPDPDNDKDTVLDADDACPLVAGVVEERGCLAKKLEIEDGQIVIKRLEFAIDKDVILARSEPILADVLDTLQSSPEITRIRIEGHTDDRGNDAANMDLSRRRARSVGKWLIEHGIAAERLEAWGCGETRPTESNDKHAGRQANRRVEFHVVGRGEDAPSADTCQQIPLQ